MFRFDRKGERWFAVVYGAFTAREKAAYDLHGMLVDDRAVLWITRRGSGEVVAGTPPSAP